MRNKIKRGFIAITNSLNHPNKIRARMYIQAASILILLQVGYVGFHYTNLVKEMDFHFITTAEAREERKPHPIIYAVQEAERVGLNPTNLIKILNCESGLNAEAFNVNQKGAGVDIGFAQINSRWHPEIPLKDKLDPYKSIDFIIKTRLQDKNYHQWECSKILGIKK